MKNKIKLKDIKAMLQNEINTFENKNYKDNALKELKNINEPHSNIEQIVNLYPSFNHIRTTLEVKDALILSVCVNPERLKTDKKLFNNVSKIIYTLYKTSGGHNNEN